MWSFIPWTVDHKSLKIISKIICINRIRFKRRTSQPYFICPIRCCTWRTTSEGTRTRLLDTRVVLKWRSQTLFANLCSVVRFTARTPARKARTSEKQSKGIRCEAFSWSWRNKMGWVFAVLVLSVSLPRLLGFGKGQRCVANHFRYAGFYAPARFFAGSIYSI